MLPPTCLRVTRPSFRLTQWHANAEHPTWSPDGQRIVFNKSPNGTVQRVRPGGSDLDTILPASEGFGAHKPWFSPDGSQLLFMCENQGRPLEPPGGIQRGHLHGGRRRVGHAGHVGEPAQLGAGVISSVRLAISTRTRPCPARSVREAAG